MISLLPSADFRYPAFSYAVEQQSQGSGFAYPKYFTVQRNPERDADDRYRLEDADRSILADHVHNLFLCPSLLPQASLWRLGDLRRLSSAYASLVNRFFITATLEREDLSWWAQFFLRYRSHN